ncbi:MAG TPA: hypothetical protein VFA60_10000 [Terriglobales bacterium]|nr:hypothetical protein [Terriglobales bacterium]
MKRFCVAVALVLGLAVVLAAQTAQAPVGVRILAPQAGQKLTQSVVAVQYVLASAGSTGTSTPEFQLRLDERDPIITRDTRYEFTGLTAGNHTLAVEVVDANRIPVQGSRAEVQFTTAPDQPERASAPASSGGPPSNVRNASSPAGPPQQDNLPGASSPLPLISIIGFGALVGGLASALKTR